MWLFVSMLQQALDAVGINPRSQKQVVRVQSVEIWYNRSSFYRRMVMSANITMMDGDIRKMPTLIIKGVI